MITISGLQEAQRDNSRMIAEMRPTGAFGRMVKEIITQRQRYELTIIHVDTGALRASIRMKIDGLTGKIFIDPAAANPRTGKLTSVYGQIEEARGGSHAFGYRTAYEGMPAVMSIALSNFTRSMP